MIRVLRLDDADGRAQALALRTRAGSSPDVSRGVAAIVADVRERGDEAVRELTERFDGVRLGSLFLDEPRWDALSSRCPSAVRRALEIAHQRVRAFHAPQIPASYTMQLEGGGVLRSIAVPLRRAACYVPGGRAAYPSTVIMTVAVARLAGVAEVFVATPPRRDGGIPAEVAAAARIACASGILLAGGAQAVAALALGTATVPRVDVIVGPGNAYVTEAKKQLSGEVRIDSLAGPSEVAIVADSSADPRQVAADLIAQGEHDPLALSLLLSPDASLIERTVEALRRELDDHPNPVAVESLRAHGAAILSRDLDEALAFADELAPEHLELLLRDAASAVARVPRAGAVFVGHHAPVPVGDYLAGPNHTLPTGGTARFASALGVSDFVRRQNVIEYGPGQLAADAGPIESLAHAEGLHGHARAIEVRRK
jgi:histidinol dehydrogenase